MKERPQRLSMPGKNSASLEKGAAAVFSMVTRDSPMAFFDISETVAGFSTVSPLSDLPRFNIMRTNFR